MLNSSDCNPAPVPWRLTTLSNHDDLPGAMASQIAKVLLSLDAEAVGSLKEGVNFKKSPEDGKCYIIFKSNNDFKACKNQCKHQGGLFIKDIEDLDGM
uniref:Rieske domain-containing protein n=1 Tax=Haplochromis burtoni TaxID=8153 RepID=A0A3Q2V784_HAPBU